MLRVLLYTLGVLALISAGSVFALCGDLWWQEIREIRNIEQEKGTSIVEDFQQTRINRTEAEEDAVSPLVKQAADFALYVNPPAPVESPVSPEPKREISS